MAGTIRGEDCPPPYGARAARRFTAAMASATKEGAYAATAYTSHVSGTPLSV